MPAAVILQQLRFWTRRAGVGAATCCRSRVLLHTGHLARRALPTPRLISTGVMVIEGQERFTQLLHKSCQRCVSRLAALGGLDGCRLMR